MKDRKETFLTGSGIEIRQSYTEGDLREDLKDALGEPGAYPFTRGIQASMYRSRFWTMRQYAGFATAEESNKRYKYLLEQGQTGLSIAFDLPTQIGYDSDDPMAEGEVGKVGVAIDSLEDMEVLFDGIPLDKVSVSMTINAPAAILLAYYIVIAEKQGVTLDQLDGTIQNDILKEYAARGTYIFPPKPSMRLITDIFAYCSQNVPNWNTISISGYHIREAGSTAVQEVAFTLSDGIAYVEAAIKAGMDVDDFAGRISFFFNAQNDLFEEAAKYRAARRLWAKIMKDRFGAKSDRSMKLRFHTQTAGCSLTAQQPMNNIPRVTIQALAAVLGGTQSLHTNSFDEALALPSEMSARTALRTQQVIAYESGVTDTVDPLAGSYYVEALTDEIEKRAMAYIEEIDRMGGATAAIEQGYIQREIAESAYDYQMKVESGEQTVVGLNKFTMEEPPATGLLRVDPAAADHQAARLTALKARRDGAAAKQSLDALRAAAGTEANLMPFLLDCARAYCTEGEIAGALRKVFGEYRPVEIL